MTEKLFHGTLRKGETKKKKKKQLLSQNMSLFIRLTFRCSKSSDFMLHVFHLNVELNSMPKLLEKTIAI